MSYRRHMSLIEGEYIQSTYNLLTEQERVEVKAAEYLAEAKHLREQYGSSDAELVDGTQGSA